MGLGHVGPICASTRPDGRGAWANKNREGIGMKRRQFLKAATPGLAASTVIAAPAIAQSMPAIKWRMPCSWPKSLDTIYGGADMICKAVAEATDNKFQIQIFAAGEIVPGLPNACALAARPR